MNEISVVRLYLLRAMYLLFVVGLGIVVWPGLLHHGRPWEASESGVACMLGAFSALSLLGLRYPLQMLPLLLWELVWKCLWLGLVGYPLWAAGTMDAAMMGIASAVLWVVIIPFVIPWDYVLAHYVRKPGERWRPA